MKQYSIKVVYTEDQMKAELDCPLCNKHWGFPFPVQEIDGKPNPAPCFIVSSHLYGTTSSNRCTGFDYLAFVPQFKLADNGTVNLQIHPLVKKK